MNEPTVLNDLYLDVLTHRLGLAPRLLDGAGLLGYDLGPYTCLLKHGGLADPSFVAVRLSFRTEAFSADTTPDPATLAAAAAHVTCNLKVAKAWADEDSILFSCEHMLGAPRVLPTAEAIVSVLPHSHDLLVHATQEFHQNPRAAGYRGQRMSRNVWRRAGLTALADGAAARARRAQASGPDLTRRSKVAP